MKRLTPYKQDILIAGVSALVISLVMAAFQPEPFLKSWLGADLLLWVSLFLLLRIWRSLYPGKLLGSLMLVTFFIRLILGVFIYSALPEIGFDTEVENAGYAYSDAYKRDTRAFELATSDESMHNIFSGKESSDQYGGLLFLSAGIYRLFGLNAARPLFITILSAAIMSAGLAFLFDAIRRRWGEKVAVPAAWFYALYPESVLLGSSQMREPFLIGLFCIAFWAVLTWRDRTVKRIIVFIISIGLMLVFSTPSGAIVTGLLAAFWLVEWLATNQVSIQMRRIGLFVLTVMGVLAVIGGWLWLKPTLYYDAYLTRLSSGTIDSLLEIMGEKWQMPFITIYGFTQPFLPAALFDPSRPFWQTTAVIRGLGWWFVLPFLPYSFFILWKEQSRANRRSLLLIILAILGWILISSLRAGGDLWDNPRYRALLIPWFAVLIGWCWQQIRHGHLAWFLRWVGVVFIFFSGFLLWYMLRYQIIKLHLNFFSVILLIAIGWATILLSGIGLDLFKKYRSRKLLSGVKHE